MGRIAGPSGGMRRGDPLSGALVGIAIALAALEVAPNQPSSGPETASASILAQISTATGAVTPPRTTPVLTPFPTPPPASAPLFNRADIAISSIQTDTLTFDPLTMVVTGAVEATIENRSTMGMTRTNISLPIEAVVTAFVDTDSDRIYDPTRDHYLGEGRGSSFESAEDYLGPGMSTVIQVRMPVGTRLPFRDAPISVHLELINAIELDPTDNVLDTGSICMYPAPRGPALPMPVEEWRWPPRGARINQPDSTRVSHSPLVADLDGDGWPEVVFVTRFSGSYGILRAIDGRDGSEKFTNSPSELTDVHTISMPAIGDVDGDGRPEIVAIGPGDTVRDVIIFGHDGSLEGRIEDVVPVRPFETGENGPYLADVDADGVPEIIVGSDVRHADGTRLVAESPSYFGQGGVVAADLQFDGRLDLISGPVAHTIMGGVFQRTWTAQSALDLENSTSRVALGAFPALTTGPFPSVAHVLAGGDVNLLDASGVIVQEFTFPADGEMPSARQGGPPLIADFDGDGEPEIAVAGEPYLAVYDTVDGRSISVASERTEDSSFGRLGSSAHDFDGDGKFEIVYAAERTMRIFRYTTGARILETVWSTARPSETNQEFPTIADVDADGRAEIIAGSDFGVGGVIVYGNPEWTGARRIWNQYDYHVDNILEDGSIPPVLRSGWREHGTFRASVPERGVRVAPDLTVSYPRLTGPDSTAGYSLTVRIGNAGGLTVGPDIPLLFMVDGVPLPGGTLLVDRALGPGQFADVTIPWIPEPGVDPLSRRLRVITNGDVVERGAIVDTDFRIRECRYDNNELDDVLGDVLGPSSPGTETPTPTSSATSTSPATPPSPTFGPLASLYLPVALAQICDFPGARLDIVLALDVSAGMRSSIGSPSAAGEGVTALLEARRDRGDRIGGVAFAADVIDSIRLDRETGSLLPWLTRLDALGTPKPGTAIHKGLREAARLLSGGAEPERKPMIVLITDGLEDRLSARESARAAESLRDAGVTVVAVAFGPAANRNAIVRLAGSEPAVRNAAGPADLGPALAELIDAASCVVAGAAP